MEYAFAMFVNPTSGGNRAGIYMQLQAQSIKFNLKQVCYVDIYNMFDKNSREQGMKELLTKQAQKMQTRVIVCGGDGTVMWVVEEMVRHGIDLVNCPVGIVPFGTGNDFSRVLGWGGDTSGDLGSCLSNLKQNIQEWVDAIVEDFDIWEVQVVAHENGYFRRIKKQDGGYIKEELYEQDKHKKVIKKNMSNYFSLGVDARIGYGFDKRRTQSACCNKVVYCCEGLKKMFMTNPTTNAVLQNMEIIADEHVDALHIDPTNVKDILFSTAQEHKYTLKGNPVTLLCINIPSYSGGAGNVWQACQGKVGLVQKGQPVVDQFHTQVFGDGEIEFVTFNTIIGMANERVISGQAQRVAQGKGPFNFRFKQSQGVNPVIQYFQVDGEFYQAINPSHLSMCHSREVPNGKIKVLVKRSFRNPS